MNTSTESIAVANVAVVELLKCATEADLTCAEMAKQAATKANETDYLDTPPAERLPKILALYMANLNRKAVKEMFSSVLAILVADKPVRILTELKNVSTDGAGNIKLQAPTMLKPVADSKEIIGKDEKVTTLEPQEAINKLTCGHIKMAATAARESLGAGRTKGAGAKPKEAPKGRAPFFEELVAVIKDEALRMQLFVVVEAAGYTVTKKEAAKAVKKP